jgi:hypothetical protein
MDGAGAPLTWIAPLPSHGEELAARAIGRGADARVARVFGETCVLLRALAPSQTLDDPAPVHVYWSADLSTWRPALPVDEEAPLLDYDLLSDGGSLWLAGVEPGPPAVARIWRLDQRDGVWTELAERVELSSAAALVRLLSSSFGAPRPKLVLAGEGETARLVELPAR